MIPRKRELARLRQKKYRAKNPELNRSRDRAHRATRPHIVCATCGKYRRARFLGLCRPCYRIRYLYRVPNEVIAAIKALTHCPLCSHPFVETDGPNSYDRCIDHNHATGELRNVICSSCNTGIGKAKDSPELCERWAYYLRTGGDVPK